MYTQCILPSLVPTKLIHYEGGSQGILGFFCNPWPIETRCMFVVDSLRCFDIMSK